jgi:hypothetical protein
VFIGENTFTGAPGEVRYTQAGAPGAPDDDATAIEADTDGDGAADFRALLAGPHSVSADDLIL